ncbi:MAG: hypothetical protein IKA48_01055 [Fibrobacter sp.]|nr:hypothetical protein [Fibrobacter sp.]
MKVISNESVRFGAECGKRIAGKTFASFEALFDELNGIARESISGDTIVRLLVGNDTGAYTRFVYLTMYGPCGKIVVNETRRGKKVSVHGVTVTETAMRGEPGRDGL